MRHSTFSQRPRRRRSAIGGEEVGQSGEAVGRAHSCRMYSIVDPSEALKAAFTQRPRSSNHWSMLDVAGIAIAASPRSAPLAVLIVSRPSGVIWTFDSVAVLGVEQRRLLDLVQVPVRRRQRAGRHGDLPAAPLLEARIVRAAVVGRSRRLRVRPTRRSPSWRAFIVYLLAVVVGLGGDRLRTCRRSRPPGRGDCSDRR